RSGIQSVHRALDVLEGVASVGTMSVTALAHDLELPISTVHSIIRTLATRHFLLRVPGGYSLGPAAATLGGRWSPVDALATLLDPALERLTAATELATTATTLIGREARVLSFVPAPGPFT